MLVVRLSAADPERSLSLTGPGGKTQHTLRGHRRSRQSADREAGPGACALLALLGPVSWSQSRLPRGCYVKDGQAYGPWGQGRLGHRMLEKSTGASTCMKASVR